MTRPIKTQAGIRPTRVCFKCRKTAKANYSPCPECGGPMRAIYGVEPPKSHQIKRWRDLEIRFTPKGDWIDERRARDAERAIEDRALYHTYNEWPTLGRYVKKGEKARHKDAQGLALFHQDQTEAFVAQSRRRPYCPDPNLEHEHEDSGHYQTLTPFDLGYDGDGR